MVSLARANLVHDWRHSVAVVSVLSLVGTLILVQVGIPLGTFRAYVGEIENSSADLLASRESRAGAFGPFAGRSALEDRHEGMVWMHPNVAGMARFSVSGGATSVEWPQGQLSHVAISVVDPAPGSVNFPRTLGDDVRAALMPPGGVVLSRATAARYQVDAGSQIRVNGQPAFVAAVVPRLWETSRERVLTTIQSARLLQLRAGGRRGDMLLVGLRDPRLLDQTRAELQDYLRSRDIRVRTRDEFVDVMVNHFLSSVGTGNTIFVAIFAIVIGFAVATQAMRGAVLAQFKEFAALRALGVSRFDIGCAVAEQAFWTGLVAAPAMVALAHATRLVCQPFGIDLYYPWQIQIACAGLVLATAVLAGLVSLVVLYRIEPAELMR